MKKKNIRTKANNTRKRSVKKSVSKKKVIKKTSTKKVVSKVLPKRSSKIIKKQTPVILKETIINGNIPKDVYVLEQFFGGPIKLKLWKIFSLNTSREFTLKDLIRLTKTKSNIIIENLRDLMKQGLIEASRKNITHEGGQKENNICYKVVKKFPLLNEITQLILTAIPRSSEKVLTELQPLQRLKTVLLSGFFTSPLGLSGQTFSATQSPIDMLLIFEKIPPNVTDIVSELEHKLGRDLSYATLDEVDFKYRHSIGDKLIRDVLDFDHVVAMDKMAFFK